MQKEIIIIGAGAHAKVVMEAIQLQGIYTLKGFCADKMTVGTKVFSEYVILGDAMLSQLEDNSSLYFIVAIGDNTARKLFFENAFKRFKSATIIHPKASVSPSSVIGDGSVILSNSCINASSVVGKNVIVNIGVLIDHDCKVGNNTHLSVGTIVGSNAEILDNYTTEIGARINSISKK